MNDDIRRSWQAANRFDAPRHPFPWRARHIAQPHPPGGDWVVVDAVHGLVVAAIDTQALAECIAALPELMGEYKPVASDAAARVAGARGKRLGKKAGELIDPAPEHR